MSPACPRLAGQRSSSRGRSSGWTVFCHPRPRASSAVMPAYSHQRLLTKSMSPVGSAVHTNPGSASTRRLISSCTSIRWCRPVSGVNHNATLRGRPPPSNEVEQRLLFRRIQLRPRFRDYVPDGMTVFTDAVLANHDHDQSIHTAQGDAPCPRHRKLPILSCWFTASG